MSGVINMIEIRKKDLEKQGYRLVGNHSSIKVCLWCKKAIRKEDTCYKHKFYGISSWRCIQASVTQDICTLNCDWCWRDVSKTKVKFGKTDEPKEILSGFIKEQILYLQGFKGNRDVDKKRLEEIEVLMNANDFWQDKDNAQKIVKEYNDLKTSMSAVGSFDKLNAVMTIFSGAGGTDAEDFSRILLEMYMKYAEKANLSIKFIHENYRQPALVEEFIPGRELNVSIIGAAEPQVLAIGEIDFSKMPKGEFHIVSYKAKWDPKSPLYDATEPIYPAKLSGEIKEKIERAAIKAYKEIGCRDYGRIDMRLKDDDKFYILEINTNPDISPEAGFDRAARVNGLSYDQLLSKIATMALERSTRKAKEELSIKSVI